MSITIAQRSHVSQAFVQDLGVVLDNTLSLSQQSHSVTRPAFSYLRVISRIRRDITARHCKLLVDSLVFSRTDYCSALYFGISKSQLQKLQMVHNAAYRLVMRLPKYSRVNDSQRECRWLTVKQRIIHRILSIVYEATHGRSASYIHELLAPRSVSSRMLRSYDLHLLDVPRVKTEFAKKAFSVCGPRLWNDVPMVIREARSLTCFLDGLNNYLLALV